MKWYLIPMKIIKVLLNTVTRCLSLASYPSHDVEALVPSITYYNVPSITLLRC